MNTAPADTGSVTEKVFGVKLDGYLFESKILSVLFWFVAMVAWMAILVFIDDAFDAETPRPFGSRADLADNIYGVVNNFTIDFTDTFTTIALGWGEIRIKIFNDT